MPAAKCGGAGVACGGVTVRRWGGSVVVWWCGDAVVWWCGGGVVVWWCGGGATAVRWRTPVAPVTAAGWHAVSVSRETVPMGCAQIDADVGFT